MSELWPFKCLENPPRNLIDMWALRSEDTTQHDTCDVIQYALLCFMYLFVPPCFAVGERKNSEIFLPLSCFNQKGSSSDHSYSRDWLWNLASFKGHNKGAAIYVESSTKVHNLLFCNHTIWLNNLTVTFLLVRYSCKIQNLLLFVHRQG